MEQDREIDIFSAIRFFHRIIVGHKFLFIAATAIILGYSMFNYFNSNKVYHTSISCTSNSVDFSLVKRILAPVEVAIQSKSYDSLSTWLDIPLEVAQSIKKFELTSVPTETNSNYITSAFTVNFTGSSNIHNIDFGQPILTYLNTNIYSKQITSTRVEKLKELQKAVDNQIQRLDSVQTLIPQHLSENTKEDRFQDFNLGTIYTELIELKDKQVETKELLEMSNEFLLLSNLKNVEKKSLISTVFFALIYTLVAVVLLSMIFGIKELVAKSLRQ